MKAASLFPGMPRPLEWRLQPPVDPAEFDDLVTRLKGQHLRLQAFTRFLAADNQDLRKRLHSQAQGGARDPDQISVWRHSQRSRCSTLSNPPLPADVEGMPKTDNHFFPAERTRTPPDSSRIDTDASPASLYPTEADAPPAEYTGKPGAQDVEPVPVNGSPVARKQVRASYEFMMDGTDRPSIFSERKISSELLLPIGPGSGPPSMPGDPRRYSSELLRFSSDGRQSEGDGSICLSDGADSQAVRMDACTQKLRELLELGPARNTASIEVFGDYLERVGKADEEFLKALEEVFTRLAVQRTPQSPSLQRARFSAKGLIKQMSGIGLEGPSVSTSTIRSRTPHVRLEEFSDLLMLDNPVERLHPCSEKMIEVVDYFRFRALRQDSMGVLPPASEVSDYKRGLTAATFDHRLETCMSFVIVVNAICMGVFTPQGGWGNAESADLAFTLIFLVEMLIKLHRHGLHWYFFGKECAWNIFDLLILALGLTDSIMTVAVVSATDFDTSSVMVFKLLRLIRLVRVVRVFRELKLMINGFSGLLKTLGCVVVIILASMYALATVLVPLFGGEGHVVKGQEMLFSTVPRSMFTVFRCLIIGDCNAIDGSPIALQLSEAVGWPFTVMHCILNVLVHYGLGSLITGLVVDTTLNEAKKAEFQATRKEAHRVQVAVAMHRLEEILADAQSRSSSRNRFMLFVGRHTFMSVVERPEVQQILDQLDIDGAERVDLFDALDADGNGYVGIDELVGGLLKMAGKASKADTVATRLKIDSLMKKLATTHAQLFENQAVIMERLHALSEGRRSYKSCP